MKNQAANNGTFIPKPGFTVVQNSVARDWNLSSGALGLYTRIQSYITMENITLTKGSLLERVPEGEYAFNTAWNELKSKGYLFIHVYPGEKGRFVCQYELRPDNSGWDGAYLFYHDRNGDVKSTNLTRNQTETAEQPAEKAAADHPPNYHPGGNHHSGNHCGGNRGGNIKLRQHRIIPALRLKRRSGGSPRQEPPQAAVALRSASLRLGVRHGICVAKMLDKTSSIICAFGLAAAAPRSPYRHLELCGIALVSFGLADEGGFLTNAGALIADESPIRWSRLFCTHGNGLDKSGGTMDALDDAEYSGSVLSLIENGEALIKRNARMMWRKTLNSREKLPEYVERSCHEAQINYRQRNRLSGSFVIDANRERYRKTPTPPTGFSCPLGVFTQVVLGVVFRQSTTASKPLKRRPAIIGRACAGLNCRVNARKSPTL